jgi:hypothetical protein
MFDKLSGYKTYALLVIALLSLGAEWLGWIPTGTFTQILVLLGIGTGFTLRSAIAKLEK